MSHTSSAQSDRSTPGGSGHLLRSSINFLQIVLMVTAAAAPLVVASTYIPISMAAGSGMSTALTYATTTVILLVFSVGFAQMAKRITSAGAFYTFTTHGLGRPIGLSVGFMITAAYSMISVAIGALCGYFASAVLAEYFGISLAWYWCAMIALAAMFAISYFKVTITAQILGVLLILEVLVVLIVSFATVGSGGAEGQVASAFNPSEWSAAPALGVGFFLAFWSWIGFETTAIYGEETTDPKRSVPRATYIAVLTLGIFYTFVAYAGTVGFGSDTPEQAGTLLDQLYFELADMHTVGFIRIAMDFLVVSGCFACSFAFHNNASRYFFSLGRDGILPRYLGRTHREHKSPHMAALTQVMIAIAVIAIFAVGGADPVLHLGTWLPIFCTLAVIVVQLLVSVAVIGYFNRVGRSTSGDYWKTLAAPAIGAVAQGVVTYLLLRNLTFLAGADNRVVELIPLYVAIIAVAGFLVALYLKSRAPETYESIGRLHDDELEDLFVDEEYVAEGYQDPKGSGS